MDKQEILDKIAKAQEELDEAQVMGYKAQEELGKHNLANKIIQKIRECEVGND